MRRLRNLLAKPPERERERVRLAYRQALDQAESIAGGERRMRAPIGELDHAGYTATAACLADDLDALLVHLRCPTASPPQAAQHTNLLERSLGEVRRPTKVIRRFPSETSCISLCWAVLDLIISRSTRVVFTDLEHHTPRRLQLDRTGQATSEEEIAA